MNEIASNLKVKIEKLTARVAVIGLGYVGLPVANTFHAAGFPVLGVDIDPFKIEQLMAGESYIGSVSAGRVCEMVESGRFEATNQFARLSETDAIIICVPTPLDRDHEPDLRFIIDTTDSIAANLRRGQLISLESTTYPGTTDEILKPKLEAGGLKVGADIFLAYSPEREDPGNRDFNTKSIPKIVGADDPSSLLLAELLYATAIDSVIPVSNTRTAEAVKITENVYRAVNIALVNELKLIYDAMGIDVWEVIDAAKTKPFGYSPFYPGPGLGGHCVPIDPFYLTWKAREFGVQSHFIELSGRINRSMPQHIVTRLTKALADRLQLPLSKARVLVVGIAYKKNVDDTRESPALAILEHLADAGTRVLYHDPLVPRIPATREHSTLTGWQSIELTGATLADFDAAVICVDHDSIQWQTLVDSVPLIVDTRNAIARHGITGSNVIKA